MEAGEARRIRGSDSGARLATPRWHGTGFGTVLADFDQDGAPDAAVVNGQVNRPEGAPLKVTDNFWDVYAQRNQLFANDGTGRFIHRSPLEPAFSATPGVSLVWPWAMWTATAPSIYLRRALKEKHASIATSFPTRDTGF